MLRVGLTGGIASGKSTVSNLFEQLGVTVIDTDVISHQLMQPGQPAFEKTIAHFGQQLVLAGGNLDRAALRKIVFEDPQQKQWLEAMLHPLIRQHTINAADANEKSDYCLIVVPLLFETGFDQLVQKVIAIDCPASVQKKRLMARDHIDAALADNMLQSQLGNAERLSKADYIIHNPNASELLPQIAQLHQKLLELAQSDSR